MLPLFRTLGDIRVRDIDRDIDRVRVIDRARFMDLGFGDIMTRRAPFIGFVRAPP